MGRPRKAAATRLGTRAFLRQVADELPSHLPPHLRDFSAEQWGRYYKVWFEEKKIHFEVQFVSGGRIEIGLHLETDGRTNERLADALQRKESSIRRALGTEPVFGSHGPGWRSVAEAWRSSEARSEEGATEAAARLAEYVVALAPLVRSAARLGASAHDPDVH